MHRNQYNKSKLFEGLRPGDLRNMVSNRFTVDQYKSKMGGDEDILVLAFRVKDKFPAIDAMEFIEKGYMFVLDADMSTGEESDGEYAVFVELERDEKVPKQVEELLKGLGRLCDCEKWRFKYFKDIDSHEFTREAFEKFIPLNPEAYKLRVKEQKMSDVGDVLNQGVTDIVDVDESNNLTISKPFAGNLTVTLDSIGPYTELVQELAGGIQLDESSNGQVLFLEKYLGNYQIHKINNKFLIRNGDKAIIISKDWW
jgi:hypothetical protein